MDYLKKQLINFLKKEAVKAALKKLLGSAAAGGFLGFVITYIVEELFEQVAEPIINLAYRKGWLLYDKAEGRLKVKKYERAKDEDDEDAYRDTIGTV